MDSYKLYKSANNLVRACGTRDPLRIAEEVGIITLEAPDFKNLLGMYTVMQRNRFMILNPNVSEKWQRLVAAHEIGHDQCHRLLAKDGAFREFVLFNFKDDTEYEANAFASHLLLDNDEVYELAREGYGYAEMTGRLETQMNMLMIKLYEMLRLGYDFPMPERPDGRFLRKFKGSGLK